MGSRIKDLKGTVAFHAGGTADEQAEAYRLFEEAGYAPHGIPVRGLTEVQVNVRGRTYEGIEGVRQYIEILKSREK